MRPSNAPTGLRSAAIAFAIVASLMALPASARTVYRCTRGGTVSLSTAPEPGSKCVAKHIDNDAAQVPNLWGNLGVVQGTLYERQQDGKTVYGTRKLPGAVPVLAFTVQTPPGSPAHLGLGRLGPPQLQRYAKEFRAASKRTGVEDAMLRAFAHAESGFDAKAVSTKGAQGVMQLMPEVAREYAVTDPFSPAQSIDGGARHLRQLLRRYKGDVDLVAAAYNAGIGSVAQYKGIPPYRETIEYVAKVQALYDRYRTALNGTSVKH
jgi:hypothetical protein